MKKPKDLYVVKNGLAVRADLYDVVDWWLYNYEGLEHMTEEGKTSPESWYTINTILRRAFTSIKRKKRVVVKK